MADNTNLDRSPIGTDRRSLGKTGAALVALILSAASGQAQQQKPSPGEENPKEAGGFSARIRDDIEQGVQRAHDLEKKKKKEGGDFSATYNKLIDDAIKDAWWWIERYLNILQGPERKKMCLEFEKHYRDVADDCRKRAGQTKSPLERVALIEEENQATADADRFAAMAK